MNSGELKDYYGRLGIPVNSTVSEIHKAYWQQASRCHPDMGGSHEEMVQVVEAWKILSNPDKRARYDQLLKYRYDGWHSKKFNDDVHDARKGAEEHASRSWAEFEEIYQKAFYIFNQDFYGEDFAGNSAGPYSPLMGSKSRGGGIQGTSQNIPARGTSKTIGGALLAYIMKAGILFAALAAALIFYRNYIEIGRYVPLGQQDASSVLILDTTDGTVHSVDKRNGAISSPVQEVVRSIPREKKSSFK
ncbi:MAG: DnaJ domain-containing protein [Steroidobacteraceae bacterium]|nr:DnaJ domain-containing protein [Deltaproteobacteria bacterium]